VTTPAAGWYPDPSGADGQRYFDGANWTDLRAVAQVRKRTRWPWVVAGVALLLLGGCGTFVVTQRNSIPSIISGDRPEVFGQSDIGVPIDDGSLRFVVNSFGKADLQSDPPPKGVYDILQVTVTNIGTASRSFAAANQKVLDALGHAHVAMGLDVARSKHDTKATEVNPGEALLVAVRFDVPAEPRIAEIELHESATSAGAKARLH
jgi:hypothetical protein